MSLLWEENKKVFLLLWTYLEAAKSYTLLSYREYRPLWHLNLIFMDHSVKACVFLLTRVLLKHLIMTWEFFFFHNKPLAWNLMTLLIEKKFFSNLNTRMSPECYIKIWGFTLFVTWTKVPAVWVCLPSKTIFNVYFQLFTTSLLNLLFFLFIFIN